MSESETNETVTMRFSPSPAWVAQSPELDEWVPAFVLALGDLSEIPRDRTADAGQYSYRYADLGDTMGVIRPKLAEHGLVVTQSVEVANGSVIVWTTLFHTSGQFVTFTPMRLGAGNSAQSAGSGITYARRYALMAVLGLATDDDDGAAAGALNRPSEARQTRQNRSRPARRTNTPEPPADAPAAPETRTEAEQTIRNTLAGLTRDERAQQIAKFREHFGCILSDLPTDRHDEALDWVMDSLAVVDPDDEWVRQAQTAEDGDAGPDPVRVPDDGEAATDAATGNGNADATTTEEGEPTSDNG